MSDLIGYLTLDGIERRARTPDTSRAELVADLETLLAACHTMRARLAAVELATSGRLTGTHAHAELAAAIERERVSER